MIDYQEMYYKMNRAMEKAINILVEAQQECEEDYLQQTESSADIASREDSKQPTSQHKCVLDSQ